MNLQTAKRWRTAYFVLIVVLAVTLPDKQFIQQIASFYNINRSMAVVIYLAAALGMGQLFRMTPAGQRLLQEDRK